MRSLAALFFTFVMVACSTAPASDQAQPQNVTVNPTVELLLTASASDFQAHRPPYPARFRNVRSGYVVTPAGTNQYLICGEFLPARENSDGTPEWTPFATSKTSGYEQWIGGQAQTCCKRPSVTWDKEDLSSSMQSHLESLQSQ